MRKRGDEMCGKKIRLSSLRQPDMHEEEIRGQAHIDYYSVKGILDKL